MHGLLMQKGLPFQAQQIHPNNPGAGWFSPDTYLFKSYSDIVLKRQPDTDSKSYLKTTITMPKISIVQIGGGATLKENRQMAVEKLK